MINVTRLLCGKESLSDHLRYQWRKAGPSATPMEGALSRRPIVVWNVTQRCNLACAHCYFEASERAGRDELTTEEARAFIADLAEMRCPVLLFSGGEPLLREDVFDLGREAAEKGIRVEGPLPADTMFVRRDEFDAMVCMYHDQALIPVKTLHPNETVNITLGLPVVRTSPGHGTAFGIAGTGRADHSGMLQAIKTAVRISRLRRGNYS